MSESFDGVEFEMPLQFAGHLAGDPQFDGMKRRVRITIGAIRKAVDTPGLNLSAQELYDEFFFDIWMRVRNESWTKKPTDGAILLTEDDITGDGERLV